jgi:peptidoglycan/LPS O-acetylase OafA/YrhL
MKLSQLPWLRRGALEPDPSPGHRADIDGLRALAILLVVVYHVWLGRVSGGVDVFLMVSAFFLTASFVRRAQGGRSLQLGAFWLRRFRRLLPAAAVTIVGVLAVALLAYPQTDWPRVWREAWSSLFYVENWTLAFSEVDYYARASSTPSPFQHFWSLSVQGQVFVLWPIIIGIAWLVVRRRRHLLVPALFAVFGAVFIASLGFSIVETAREQSFAYFDTRTRLWEFAAGSLIALALPYLRLPGWSAAVLGWMGVAGIVLCGIVIDVQGGFPGYLALWPVACTALVIVAGHGRPQGGPSAFLSSKQLRFVSRDAYALYLVHWPVLITWMVLSDRSEPGLLAGSGIVLVSFVLARLLSAFVERPLREARAINASKRLGVAVLAAAVLVVAVPLGAWQVTIDQRRAALTASESGGYPGAAQIDTPVDLAGVNLPLMPLATALDEEWVDLGNPCTGTLVPGAQVLAGSCVQTERASEAGVHRVLVMGDSHAQQLMSPLKAFGEGQDWELVALLKGGCSIAIGAPSSSTSGPPCDEWRVAAIDYALQLQPDAVYLVVTRASSTSEEVLLEGIEDIAAVLTDRGIEVIAVRDNPRFEFDMYECALRAESSCEVVDVGLADESALEAFGERDGVVAVDFRPWLCPNGTCLAAVGNVALYIDDNHLSDAYGRTLAPMLQSMLDSAGALAAATG